MCVCVCVFVCVCVCSIFTPQNHQHTYPSKSLYTDISGFFSILLILNFFLKITIHGRFRNLYLAARNFSSVALEGVDAAAVFFFGGGRGDLCQSTEICACPLRWPWKVKMQCVCVCARAHERERGEECESGREREREGREMGWRGRRARAR